MYRKIIALGVSFLVFGCNPFSLVDKPSGDAQLLSAARACFDQGNYVCATQYYAQVSSAYADQVTSETIFQTLAQNGMTVSIFMNAVIANTSNAGQMITQIAGNLTSVASQTTRLNMFHAVQKSASISDPQIQGLAMFIAGIAVLAEMFAEDATTQGILKQSDFVATPTACLNLSLTPPNAPYTNCQQRSSPPDIILNTGSTVPNLVYNAVDIDMSGQPTLYMIDAAIQTINNGQQKMNTQGSLGSSTGGFATTINAQSALIAGTPNGYRGYLLQNGIGAN